MAQRRMFSLKVVDTDRFLDMPSSAQSLYFHLGMRADDEGFVASPKRITALVGSAADDLSLLVTKGFIIPFASGICVITNWKQNNYIQADRFQPTFYADEKALLSEKTNQTYQLDTECIQNASKPDTQVRLGKVRRGKDKLKKTNGAAIVSKDPLSLIYDKGLREDLQDCVLNWIGYKKEQKRPYKEQGLKSFLTTLTKNVSVYGENRVIDVINEAMGNNYQGVVWDKLKSGSKTIQCPADDLRYFTE